MFQHWFHKRKTELTGAPAIRRVKSYSAASGYVYQYFYQGHRPYSANGEQGVEYAFSLSSDRKTWQPAGVFLSSEAVGGWETAHHRALSATERYAVAKVALFRAFDERPTPAHMKESIRVRRADVEGIVETLDL